MHSKERSFDATELAQGHCQPVLAWVILALMVGLAPVPSGWDTLNGHALLVFLGLGVLSTAIPTIGFAVASKRLPAVVTATISLFIPLFAGLFYWVFPRLESHFGHEPR